MNAQIAKFFSLLDEEGILYENDVMLFDQNEGFARMYIVTLYTASGKVAGEVYLLEYSRDGGYEMQTRETGLTPMDDLETVRDIIRRKS